MDSTNSRKSDVAATRKRRSSILKCQRAPRAPLSELEFNVATPQEQAKSRRVSFSRRTGVAEFEINEATTAWKNVYEEHNKSLETSGNESGGGTGARRRVAHLAGRAAHQFCDAEAEAVDAADSASASASPPRAELSALPDHHTVQLFRLDANPAMRDLTDRLALDFSDVAPLDDLDALQRDLERDERRGDLSEISIDVDFNATHVSLRAEESGDDMSITDTIRSPRVAAAAPAPAPAPDDWLADKENVLVNPYAPPPPLGYANDDCDDVLVFDGKKCKFQSNLDLGDDEALGDRIIISDEAASGHGHGTEFLDYVADITVPEAVPAQMLHQKGRQRRKTIVYDKDEGHMSMTEAAPARILQQKYCTLGGTVVHEEDDCQISMTEAVPAQILLQRDSTHGRTIVQEEDDCQISMTEAVPARILEQRDSTHGRTIVHEEDDCQISMTTEAVPARILQQRDSTHGRTIVQEEDDCQISMTEAVPARILEQRDGTHGRTIVHEEDDCQISMTEAVPARILQQRDSTHGRTIVQEEDDCQISMTEAVPARILEQRDSKHGRTIVHEEDDCQISMTEAVPARILEQRDGTHGRTIVHEEDDCQISMTEAVPARILQQEDCSHGRTIVHEENDCQISMTEAVPARILHQEDCTHGRTIVHEEDDCQISMTEAVPARILHQEDCSHGRTIVHEEDDCQISMTEAVPARILQQEDCSYGRTIVHEEDDCQISMTEAVPARILHQEDYTRGRTIVHEEDDCQISMTEAVPARILHQEDCTRGRTIVQEEDDCQISMTEAVPARILQQKDCTHRRTTVHEEDDCQISMTEAVPARILQQKDCTHRRTTVHEEDDCQISMTEAVPVQILQQGEPEQILQQGEPDRRRRTAHHEDAAHATTDAVRQVLHQNEPEHKQILHKNNDDHASMPEAPPLLQNCQRKRTILYNFSMTDSVPARILQHAGPERRNTTDDAHMSVTAPLPARIVQDKDCKRRNTIAYENGDDQISMSEAVPALVLQQKERKQKMRRTEVVPAQTLREGERVRRNTEGDHTHMSSTKAVPASILQQLGSDCRRTIAYEKDDDQVSMTDAVPAQMLWEEEAVHKKAETEGGHVSTAESVLAQILPKESDWGISAHGPEKAAVSAPRPVPSEANSQSPVPSDASLLRPIPSDASLLQPISDVSLLRSFPSDPEVSSAAPRIGHGTGSRSPSVHERRRSKVADDSASNVVPVSLLIDTRLARPKDALWKTILHEDSESDVYMTEAEPARPDATRERDAAEPGMVSDHAHAAPAIDRDDVASDTPGRRSPGSASVGSSWPALVHDGNTLLSLARDHARSRPASASPERAAPARLAGAVPDRAAVLGALLDMSHDQLDETPALATPRSGDSGSDSDAETRDKAGALLTRRLGETDGALSFRSTPSPDKEEVRPPRRRSQDTAAGADDTRALLAALGELTDSRHSGDFDAARPPAPLALVPRSHAALRRSLVRSREDLLKDISLAQAMMRAEDECLGEQSPESPGVVRTLRFDDEDSALLAPAPHSSAPIPAYLQNVSDSVKELMEDLIKPMADVAVPFASDYLRADPPRSSQVQVDWQNSSQIDLLPDKPVVLRSTMRAAAALSPSSVSSLDLSPPSATSLSPPATVVSAPARRAAPHQAVVVFDHRNPLNNVVLAPPGNTEAHRYSPRTCTPVRSVVALSPVMSSHGTQTERPTECRDAVAQAAPPTVAAAQTIECGLVLVSPPDAAAAPPGPALSVSRDLNVRDTEVNTSIVMKANHELLASSSSLTLVDDALAQGALEFYGASAWRSSVRDIFRLEEPECPARPESGPEEARGPKRGRSSGAGPVTPRPALKVQKVSESRSARRLRSVSLARPAPQRRASGAAGSPPSPRNSAATQRRASSSQRSRSKAPRAPEEPLGAEIGPEDSPTSSDWQPEELREPSSMDQLTECESGTNVVAKIDMLPFMGTSDCEWESRASDTWCFRLMRARLRLVVRLEHRSENNTRALVRADTPVRHVLVQHTLPEHGAGAGAEHLWAAAPVRLAAAALQALGARAGRAGAVPALLRRGAGAARAAVRWGRAMRAAHRQLAFSLGDDGLLSLKVANIPLCSVWEVTLRVRMQPCERGDWPRATCPRAARVVAGWAPRDDELESLLEPIPQDWGHVPRAVWKIFKYLKNKKPDDITLVP